ncbi:ABC-2 type transporter-domain-containing protein [Truncatella angustata]|uniref:ABC-2 type transporter-domain-containing protein n=1 Tax=Truncatella angustata TaxID=152316 RepID=A0A9P8UUW2_9PEZI|nr:ABC-2 type transporter-domain-containing protein [Truncatella angustata]KAH6658751.1 ABC-2 type transporter-domain-containing protein [Truncatella angustata]
MTNSALTQWSTPGTDMSSAHTAGSESTCLNAVDNTDNEQGSSESNTGDGTYDESDGIEMERRCSAVQSLARQYTQHSTVDTRGNAKILFASNDPNSPVNPLGEKFNARAWAKNIANLTTEHGHGYRTAGVCYENLNVFGYGNETDYQKDVSNIWLEAPNLLSRVVKSGRNQRRIDILRDFNGVIEAGEMCVVLGPPGSGCSTLLKTLAGETNGIYTDGSAYFNYQGLSAEEMHKHHAGDAIYAAEVDVHFPMLSVGDTLTFASRARSPRTFPQGLTRNEYCSHLRDVVMAMYGISHTVDTRVGDNYIRGVSGGERKRVTIAEATLSNAPFQCWDNSTRGLDSANAIEFCKTLRLQSDMFGQTCAVSIYQAPQSAYDLFDKALVLYEGRQIYFGVARGAKEYFTGLGFECPARQTTPDFLTSMTAPSERVVRPGWESRVPRTPDDFAACWKQSQNNKGLMAQIGNYKQRHPLNGTGAEEFRAHKKEVQANGQRLKSPFTLSYANSSIALIVSSLFYNLQQTTGSFYSRAAVMFVAILFNAFSSALEILTQYSQRPIVEKHVRYGFYHASAESYSSVLIDLPYKIANAIFFNAILYFMSNLNRTAGAFFFFMFVGFLMTLTMSGLFRSIAALSRTLSQAMVPAAILILALVIFTGFVIPVDYMLGWCRWINYLDPVAYGFESLMINEFHNRNYECSDYVPSPAIPGYEDISSDNMACSAVGAVKGQSLVSGDSYINSAYKYFHVHKWRNVGILIAFVVGLHLIYFIASEYMTAKKSKGEVLVFRRGVTPPPSNKGDVEASMSGPLTIVGKTDRNTSSELGAIQGSTSVFHWSKVCYDVKIKSETRRILDHVDGWVKPGTLTALMGVSGAGKTTLLDCLADRISVGVITGSMLVNGKIRDSSFQRQTGYVQQQDLHLETSTVREALEFSALLRQPASTPRTEKLAYVDEVIKLLDMQEYADAVVGVLGEGLNVEQRKRLTIGVELAAKPPLLLFVDEPTSGLDSQTSWAILDLLEKLSKAGQSVLCTIHQPSAMLFQRFDRLLFLAKGGRTVYFGDIGAHSKTLTSYFEGHGAPPCPEGENPAEWMLSAIGAAPGSHSDVDWHQTWRSSSEYEAVQAELQSLESYGLTRTVTQGTAKNESLREFASPLREQFLVVTRRVFQQYWRTPSYIYSKAILCVSVSLFIGLVFLDAPLSIQGLQNQMFAIFNVLSIFGQLVQQQMPHFVTQRSLYEVRERPSKTYSWKIFMLSQIVVEIPWNSLMSLLMWICLYYPVGFYKNAEAAGQTHERGALMWLLIWQFLIFTCTFAHACISVTDTAEAGGNVANLLFTLCLFFCGVLATPNRMPGFWIFMYRVSPFTYLISAMLSTGLANTAVTCATNELVSIVPPSGQTCGEYLGAYMSAAGGYVVDSNATESCSFCSIAETNVFLTSISSSYANRWRDFGIGMVYIAFNIAAALFLYWLVRMPKGKNDKTEKKKNG